MHPTENQQPASEHPGVDAILTRHGGLTYLEIPAKNPQQSAAFYQNVLGFLARDPDSKEPKFSDPTGDLIGRWITGREPSANPGLLPYFYVDRIDDAVNKVVPNGGKILKPPYTEGNLFVALVQDPAGNTIGLWQAKTNDE